MSWYATELHKYVIGESRVDGWVSDWRREQERRRKEASAKPRPTVKPKQIKRVYSDRQREIVGKSLLKRRERLKAEGICRDCGKNKVKEGCTSCEPCLKSRYDRQKRKREELKKAA